MEMNNLNFEPQQLTYTIFEEGISSIFNPGWTTVPEICNFEYIYTLTPDNPDLITIDQSQSFD